MLKKYLHNIKLCLKYPFLFKDTLKETWYDSIDEGWKQAFGKQLLDDLKQAVKTQHKDLKRRAVHVKKSDIFTIFDIRTYDGALKIYALASKEIAEVLEKYTQLSKEYCHKCGQPVKYKHKGLFNTMPLEYVCKDCFNDFLDKNKLSAVEKRKLKTTCRASKRKKKEAE